MTKYKDWALATLIRTIRTAAAVALGSIGAAATLDGVDWDLVLRTTGLSMVVTVLLALTGLPEINGAAIPLVKPNPGDKGAVNSSTILMVLLIILIAVILVRIV